MQSLFNIYWSEYSTKTIPQRRDYFYSLPHQDRRNLIDSFFEEKWFDMCIQNMIDHFLDYIKNKYNIDIVDLRIKAIKLGKVFLVDRETWDMIENEIFQYDQYTNIDAYIGGLLIKPWGKNKQFYRIRSKKIFI